MNIKDSLLRRAQELHISMPKLMQHYAMERFLYRLSLSPYAEKFYLKGGMLLMGMGAGAARTTMDIDLLGRIANSPDSVLKAVRSIIRTKPGVADGVHFSDDDIRAEEITKDARYVGLRVLFSADVAGMACTMKIDIGFSDEIYPEAMELDYPATLPELPGARLLCYSAESMVAEKWQAMVQLKEMNSRMKDFYDLWFLSRTHSFNYPTLKRQSRAPSPAGKQTRQSTLTWQRQSTSQHSSRIGLHTCASSKPPHFRRRPLLKFPHATCPRSWRKSSDGWNP